MKYMVMLLLIATLFLAACAGTPEANPKDRGLQEECEQAQGTWLKGPQECEGVSEQACDEMGGHFNGCASACRNDPDAEICTMQCVIVCEFKEGAEIPYDCVSWFDGCNTCIAENGELKGCTKKFCPEESLQEAECLEYRQG